MPFQTYTSDGDYFKPEHVGDNIEGWLISIESIIIQTQAIPVATIKTENGNVRIWLGAKLRSTLPDLMNRYIKIIYKGTLNTVRGQMKDFQVQVDASRQRTIPDDSTDSDDDEF